MLDLAEFIDGNDVTVVDTIVMKAANVLSVQLGALEYAQEFGVDLNFFVQSGLQFQNESFKSYLVQRLIENQVNVTDISTTIDTLMQTDVFRVGDLNPNTGGLIL